MFGTHVGHRLICESNSPPPPSRSPWFIPVFLPVLGMRSSTGASFFMFFQVSWPSSGGIVRFIPCQPRLGLSSRPRESCDIQVVKPLLDFFDYPEGASLELQSGTLKLHYSPIPFSKRFPSWLVPDLSSSTPVVCASPGPGFIFPTGTLCMNVQRNVTGSQVRAQLTSVLVLLLGSSNA